MKHCYLVKLTTISRNRHRIFTLYITVWDTVYSYNNNIIVICSSLNVENSQYFWTNVGQSFVLTDV